MYILRRQLWKELQHPKSNKKGWGGVTIFSNQHCVNVFPENGILNILNGTKRSSYKKNWTKKEKKKNWKCLFFVLFFKLAAEGFFRLPFNHILPHKILISPYALYIYCFINKDYDFFFFAPHEAIFVPIENLWFNTEDIGDLSKGTFSDSSVECRNNTGWNGLRNK